MPNLPDSRPPLPKRPVEVIERVDVGQRVSIGLIAMSLSLISLALGLAFLSNPAALLVLPTVDTNVTPSSATAVTLNWTAPGDDGTVGQATAYEIRYASAPITEVNFSTSSLAPNPPIPQPAGSSETYSVINLQPATTYFFALKSTDEAGNVSAISNVATKTTDALPVACIPIYTCTSWSTCANNLQTRTCTVTNGCAEDLNKPITQQACTSPITTPPPTPPTPPPTGGDDTTITNPLLAVGVGVGSVPVVRTVDYRQARVLREWLVFARSNKNGTNVATGDLDGDRRVEILVGTGRGSDPLIKVYTDSGQLITQFNPYPTSRGIGVSLATGDVDGDGNAELLTVPAGSAAHLRIFDYQASNKTFTAIGQSFVYDRRHLNGFTVDAGDIDLDGKDEFIVTARTNGASVSVLRMNSDRTITRTAKFNPYGILLTSGITVAMGDINGDARSDIVTTGGPGLWSHVKVFNGQGRAIADFLPTSKAYRGGVDLSVFDVDQDGREEVLTATYGRGDPSVWAFRYNGLTRKFERIKTMFVFPRTMLNGLRIDAAPHQ